MDELEDLEGAVAREAELVENLNQATAEEIAEEIAQVEIDEIGDGTTESVAGEEDSPLDGENAETDTVGAGDEFEGDTPPEGQQVESSATLLDGVIEDIVNRIAALTDKVEALYNTMPTLVESGAIIQDVGEAPSAPSPEDPASDVKEYSVEDLLNLENLDWT